MDSTIDPLQLTSSYLVLLILSTECRSAECRDAKMTFLPSIDSLMQMPAQMKETTTIINLGQKL
jgi:hypothetical protein